jgi:DNA anti-recombination protein RmuC
MLGRTTLFEAVMRSSKRVRAALPVLLLLWLGGCESAYYGAMERVGFHKRDILVDRVAAAMKTQEEAAEEFENALEQFSSVVSVPDSKLRRSYDALNRSFTAAESKADQVSQRIDAVESVSSALFDEWREEIEVIGNAELKSSSASQLRRSEAQYETLMRAMRQAEKSMEPVLATFRDYVLYLKHNLNAQAIASLEGELAGIEADVSGLVRDMQASIEEARSFLQIME